MSSNRLASIRVRHSHAGLPRKRISLKNSVHIHAASRADAERLDELLWTFRDGSFVPHERISDASGNSGSASDNRLRR